jgi:hypothetical protein
VVINRNRSSTAVLNLGVRVHTDFKFITSRLAVELLDSRSLDLSSSSSISLW